MLTKYLYREARGHHNINTSSAHSFVLRYGPSARDALDCFGRFPDYTTGPIKHMEDKIESTLKAIGTNITGLLDDQSLLHNVGSAIVFIRRPMSGNMDFESAISFVPTPYLTNRLETHLLQRG